MLTVSISEKGGKPLVREFEQTEVNIGRVRGNDIVLPKSNVSKHHLRILHTAAGVSVEDTKSTNGTYINGKRLTGTQALRANDMVMVGDFTLEVRASGTVRQEASSDRDRQDVSTRELPGKAAAEPSPSAAAPQAGRDQGEEGQEAPWDNSDDAQGFLEAEPVVPTATLGRPDTRDGLATASPRQTAATIPLIGDAQSPMLAATVGRSSPRNMEEALCLVHRQMSAQVDQSPVRMETQDLKLDQHVGSIVHDIVEAMRGAGDLPASVQPQQLMLRAVRESTGMGPLEPLLHDASISEILVNDFEHVYVEREGRLELTPLRFSSEDALMALVKRIAQSNGRTIDIDTPMLDGRLGDGSRINAVAAPMAVHGTCLTIRRFSQTPLLVDDLVAGGSLSADMSEFLEACVKYRRNIIISGGTGSGKTTLLNVLSGFISENERILTIEDAAELKLDQEHVVSLEARPAMRGRAAVTIRDLVRNALRMRPDRIVVGECRGGEALDMLQAMNTGHDGSLTTVHANSSRDCLARLETMVLMSGMDLPIRAIREQIASAVDIVVQQSRFADGHRRITAITEIVGMESEIISMHDLFVFETQGVAADGRIAGRFKASGYVPKFYEELRSMGMQPNLAIFRKS